VIAIFSARLSCDPSRRVCQSPQLRGQEPAIEPVTDDAFRSYSRVLGRLPTADRDRQTDRALSRHNEERKAPHGPGHTECDTEGQRLPGDVTYPNGVSISSSEAFPTQAEAIEAAALKVLDMPERLADLDRPDTPTDAVDPPSRTAEGCETVCEQKKGGSPDGLPPKPAGQNSSLRRPGTVSMTRSSMALGKAP
jgi:hypothetical protein